MKKCTYLCVALAITTSVLMACGAEPTKATEAQDGLWQGFVPFEQRDIRLELNLSGLDTPQPAGTLDLPDLGALNVPVTVTNTNGELSISAPFGVTLDVAPAAEPGQLTGLYTRRATAPNPVTLIRDNPAFKRFSVPRLGADGSIVTTYDYSEPSERNDGWDAASLTSVAIDETAIEELVEAVLRGEHGRLETMVIVRDGKIVLDEYFYGFAADRPHSVQSITKSVTSLLIGVAKDLGHLDRLERPIHEFFPEYTGKRWIDERYPITLWHALTMSAAIDWNERLPYSNPQNSNTAMNATGDWIGYVLDRAQAGEPGQSASYTSGLSILLGGVIKNATGKYVDEFATASLFSDLSVGQFHWLGAPDGTRHTGGGLLVTARDLAKMGQLVLTEGVWRGR